MGSASDQFDSHPFDHFDHAVQPFNLHLPVCHQERKSETIIKYENIQHNGISLPHYLIYIHTFVLNVFFFQRLILMSEMLLLRIKPEICFFVTIFFRPLLRSCFFTRRFECWVTQIGRHKKIYCGNSVMFLNPPAVPNERLLDSAHAR